MKSFRQVINEQPENDKLDKLIHNIPLSKKRLKQLTNFSDLTLMFDFDGWQDYPYPSNSSKVVFDELQYLISLQEFRDQWETDMRMHDTKVITTFKKYLSKHNLDVDLESIKEILDKSNSIILSLKRFYNRPRPKVLAEKLGIGFSFFPLKTAETPSYPSGHATLGRLGAKLILDEVPFEHTANILKLGEDIGHGRMIAGAHYPSDTEFGHRLGDELYRLATTSKESDLTLEELDFYLTEGRFFDTIKGGIMKLKAVWTKLKSYIMKAFKKVKNLRPYDTLVFTIPGLTKEDIMASGKTKDGKLILEGGALSAIKGNYNEALVVKYLYDQTWSSVEIDLNETSPGGKGWGGGKSYATHKKDANAAVADWNEQLKAKIDNWQKPLDVIQKGSKDMAKYLNGSAYSNGATIRGGWVDNLAIQKGVNFKADIRVATQKANSKTIVTGYSLKIYKNKSIGLTNNTARSLAKNLGGPAAEKAVDRALESDTILLGLIDTVKIIKKEYEKAKTDPKKVHMSKRGGELYQARQDARSPINKRFATIVYEAIKSVPHDVFVKNLLHLLGFDDVDTKMLLSVVKASGKREIIDKHPDLDLSKIELVHKVGTVSIRVVGPTGKTIVTFGTKEGERKAVSGKVSFANLTPVDLDEPAFNQLK